MDFTPVGFKGNRLNLLSINDAHLINDPSLYLSNISSPVLMSENREYSIIDKVSWPFPIFTMNSRPDPWKLSQSLFENFDLARRLIPQQSDIGSIIENQVRNFSPNVVLLMIADGLSYFDLPDEGTISPILVNGVTNTEFGYRAVAGDPHISRRLFALGYREIKAFSFYQTEGNNLSFNLHDPFSTSEIIRVKEFDEILKYFEEKKIKKGYIQIITSGLDQLSHHHHDRPPIDVYRNNLIERFNRITELLHKINRPVLSFLTSDHGILWRDLVEDKIEIASDLFYENSYSPRYIKGALLRNYGRVIKSMDQTYTLLGVPWMTRRFRNDEWGVHGGISAWESIVPLISQYY